MDLQGARVSAPVVLKDDGSGPADELTSGTVKMAVHVSGDAPVAARLGSRRSAGARLQGVHVVSDSERLPRNRAVRGRRGPSNLAGDEHLRRRSTPTPRKASSSSRSTGGRCACGRSPRGPSAFTSCSRTRRAARKPTPRRGSSTPTWATTARVVLDFNQAYNPPCAFNPYTTCPIPLPENRLPVKVLAGERAYPGPRGAAGLVISSSARPAPPEAAPETGCRDRGRWRPWSWPRRVRAVRPWCRRSTPRRRRPA